MNKSDASAADVLDYVFMNVKPSWADDAEWLLRLHTGEPGQAGQKLQHEADYPGYQPVTVARSGEAWQREGTTVRNSQRIRFGTCPIFSTSVLTHWSITRAGSKPRVLYRGKLLQPLRLGMNIRPEVDPGGISVQEA